MKMSLTSIELLTSKHWKDSNEFSMKYKFKCCGPDMKSGRGESVPKEKIGTETTISSCVAYANCTCPAYRKAIDILESLEEEEMEI